MRPIFYFTIMITVIKNFVCGGFVSRSKPSTEYTFQTIGSNIICGGQSLPAAHIDIAARKACDSAIPSKSCVSRFFCPKKISLYTGTDENDRNDKAANEYLSVIHSVKSKFISKKVKVYALAHWDKQNSICKAKRVFFVVDKNPKDQEQRCTAGYIFSATEPDTSSWEWSRSGP
ncbi:hypothetical protein GcM1_160009 [Golovinomyces cichoracearum]|uniref:Uncharacterized protein n=1 Tax=Golovinomyces cichoracearum TaxID=62708 RepID=A0A420J979_9PEZI|nr:hypothetical protein GcM1_160009 [Golovinomyces cichoracearum]